MSGQAVARDHAQAGGGDFQHDPRDQPERGPLFLFGQEVSEALNISSRAYVLQTGRIVLEGKGADLLKWHMNRKAYLGMQDEFLNRRPGRRGGFCNEV